MVQRLELFFIPMKYQPDYMYLRHVPIKRVHLFTVFQVGMLGLLCIIKEIKSTSILFPVMVSFPLNSGVDRRTSRICKRSNLRQKLAMGGGGGIEEWKLPYVVPAAGRYV